MALNSEQVSALDGHVDEFRAAGYQAQERIIQNSLGSFEKACPLGTAFKKKEVEIVHSLSAALDFSQTFYSSRACTFSAN